MSEQFCLRWNNHQSTLISVFETLLESGSLIDCTLCAEGQLLKAHKVVLSACSPIFESMLCIQEDKHPIIFLKDVKFIELKAMLDYMYKGEVNILQDQLDSFLRTAAALQIKGLTDQGGGGGDEPPAKKGPGRKTGMSDVAPESPLVGNAPLREGSVSPTRRRRRIPRRPSSAEDASADNSCDIPPPAVAPPAITPATGALPVSEPLHRSSLSATTVKAKQEPIDTPLVTPKQEFVEETNEEIEDLTLDDDDDYNDSMSDMSKPGTSFGAMNPGSTSQQDFSQWQQMMGAADRSGTDEVFMAAQEAINNQTNTQGRSKKKDKKTSDEPVMSSEDDLTGTGSSGFEITVIQAGNGKLYSDGNGHFYRISKHCVAEGDVRVSFMRCTYETCKGQAVMRRKGNNITLYPENVHTCEPNTFFQNVTALRETILHRCEQERRKGLKNIFMEETSSYELSAAVRAALSYETLLSSMEEARAKNKKPLKPTPAKTVESASKKRPKPTTPKEKTENVTEYVYINEDGTLEDSEYIDEDELLKDCASDDDEEKEVKTKCIIVTPKTETITVVKPGKTIHKPRVDLGPGLPALKIPGRKGSASIYTDGNDYFYRKGRHTVLKGDLDTWYMSCTYQDCQGKAIMQERDSVLMLYHRNSHSCEPIPCLADLIDIKQKIMERCKTDPITPLKQIFEEETMSPEYAPEIGALLSFQSMEAAMQRARKLSIRSKKWSSENLD